MINLGIAGLGWWGQVLVNAVQGKSDAVRFTAAATRTQSPEAQAYAASQGIDLRNGFEDLLRDPAIDAIVLATPHSMHRDQIDAAAQAGKHIFTEKPFTLTRSDAEAAITSVRDAGVVLGLGFQRRFHPAMAALRSRVQAGELGTILQITCTLGAPIGLTQSRDHWRADAEEAPAGALTPLGVHAIDGIVDILGEVDTVYCASARRVVEVSSDDTTALILRLKDGTLAQVSAQIATGLNYQFNVFGSRGWESLSGYPEFARHERQLVGESLETYELEPFDMIRAELEAFATAVSGGTAFPISQEQMIHTVAVQEAAVRSALSGVPEKIA